MKKVAAYIADSMTSLAIDADVTIVDKATSIGRVASLIGKDCS